MLFHDAGVEANRLCELRPEALIAPSIAPVERGGREFAALSRTPLASQFFSWRGVSGKSYVFTVFAPSYCPAFCDVVLLAVARDDRGRRRILTALDTGAFPEPVLARAERQLSVHADALEFHVHLLARSLAERRAALADLKGRPEPR